MCLNGKKHNNLFFPHFYFAGVGCGEAGAYIFLCLLPFNSNFEYFEIKSLVPRNSNLRDSTVVARNCIHLQNAQN